MSAHTTLSRLSSSVHQAAEHEQAAYSHGERRPLGGYVKAMTSYAGGVVGLVAAIRLSGRPVPGTVSGWDVALVTGATHKLSRLLAKDSVTSPLRAPFTSYQGASGDAELQEQVRGDGDRHAVGELITCPFCLGLWVSTAFIGGLVLAPGPTRLVAAGLTALAGSDFLQLAYAHLQQAA